MTLSPLVCVVWTNVVPTVRREALLGRYYVFISVESTETIQHYPFF